MVAVILEELVTIHDIFSRCAFAKIYEIINIGGAAYGGGGFNFGRRFKKINKMMVVTFE